YSWDRTQLENNQGSVVWSGSMGIDNVKNGEVVTLIPIHDLLKGQKPGAYVLVASDAAAKKDDNGEVDGELATQWVVDSDIAITSFQGAGGLSVFARSFASARPLAGVKLTLVARDNNELATAVTNNDGRADFDAGLFRATGGDEPVVVMAYGANGDFSFLDLRRSAFDLTDRGVGGRASPGPVDAFLYTERGIYRPGETVQLVTMLRDRVGAAVSAPLTLVASRPDGMEVGRVVVPAASLQAGSAPWSLPLSSSAPHGRWQIAAYIDPKADPVGRVQFDVQDFVPQKLKVVLTAEEKILQPKSDFHVKVESRFLYGAPASGLSADGQARISADADPFPAYVGYAFGRVDDTFSDVNVDLTVPVSDATGVSIAAGNVGELADTTLPLKALIKISVHEPGGRTTDKTTEIPIATRNVFIGIRPDFDGGSVAENARAGFEVIAVDANGKRVGLSGLIYSWVREDTNYQWFQTNGEWKYQSTTRDHLITSGTMALGAGAPAKMAQSMPYGTYRLTISDPKSGAASSSRFYSGWAASSAGDRPDRIPVAADRPNYAIGSIAHVHVKPNANGKALVVVAGDKVFSSRVIDAPAGGMTVDVPVSADWGAGAYVLVTDYRPLNEASGHEAVRSIGLTWLGVDNGPRTLVTSIGGPAKILPRQKLNIPVTIRGLASGEDAYVTLAAVDEGILQLTEYKSPDPVDYYFGKRRLGVNMRDDYGRLIKADKAPVGILESGGDSFGGRSLAVVPTRTVALFSGIVKLGSNGVANIPLDVPDFNGELRLMAVAWSANKLGHADRALTVRDPVVADIVLPRFLAPGDHASAALNLDNVEGKPGAYVATIQTKGPLGLASGQNQTVVTQTLRLGQRALVSVDLKANGIGISGIALNVKGPGGFNVTRGWPLEIRAAQLDVARDEELPLKPGASYVANRQLVSDLIGSTAQVSLTVSAAHGFSNVAGLLKWLDKYPYGCIEQTVSTAQPLLLFNNLADLAGLPRDAALHARVQDAIDRALDMQNYSGDFGMWGPGNDSDAWVSVYALDFLYQAKLKGYVVPAEALRRGASWLKSAAGDNSNDDETRAYAFYVLAREGQVNISDLRYFSDTKGGEMKSGIAAALIGAAAAQVGDRSRAAVGFNHARDLIVAANPDFYEHDVYGSLLRDTAGVLALAAENGEADLLPALLKKADTLDMRMGDTTTQEKGWMLRAAYALTKQKTPLNILVNGKPAMPRDNAVRLSPSLGQLSAGVTLLNRGDALVWRTTSVQGTPNAPLPAENDGLTLTKTIWTMSGAPADLSRLHQNDRVIVELSGRMANDQFRQMGIIDMLPAGLEIEQPLSGDDAKIYPWLGTLSDTARMDARDDRFVAAFNIGSDYIFWRHDKKAVPVLPEFHIAYVARAITLGEYAMPAGVAEDMYAPSVHARTAMGRVTIGQ
ncbi:MAG TPA: alpha-2-macroglobulin, partial [Rhizomicrobium sp.]